MEIVGQDGFEAGLVAGFGRGEALVVGGGECGAEPFAVGGGGGGGGGSFLSGSREGRDEGESKRTSKQRQQRAEGEFHEERN